MGLRRGSHVIRGPHWGRFLISLGSTSRLVAIMLLHFDQLHLVYFEQGLVDTLFSAPSNGVLMIGYLG